MPRTDRIDEILLVKVLVGAARGIRAHPFRGKRAFFFGEEFGGLGVVGEEEPDAHADDLSVSCTSEGMKGAMARRDERGDMNRMESDERGRGNTVT